MSARSDRLFYEEKRKRVGFYVCKKCYVILRGCFFLLKKKKPCVLACVGGGLCQVIMTLLYLSTSVWALKPLSFLSVRNLLAF